MVPFLGGSSLVKGIPMATSVREGIISFGLVSISIRLFAAARTKRNLPKGAKAAPVIDLMVALKKSLAGHFAQPAKPGPCPRAASAGKRVDMGGFGGEVRAKTPDEARTKFEKEVPPKWRSGLGYPWRRPSIAKQHSKPCGRI